MALKKTNLVEKKNVLNEIRSNNMTLQELRFFSIYLSKINPRDIKTRVVRFPLDDFKKIMEFTARLNINQLKATTNSLLSKVVNVPTERGGYKGFQLFKECTVDQDDYGEWYVEIDAHDKALPLMFDFKEKYFTYELWNALRLKSSNQLRMYEILKQYETIGKRDLSLEELRALIGIGPKEYPRWDNFKVRILDSCQAALAETTDICYTYKPIKKGAKIVGVHFDIKKNTNYVDQLTLAEFMDMQTISEGDAEEEAVIEVEYTEVAPELPTENGYEGIEEEFEMPDDLDMLMEACDNEFSRDAIRIIDRNMSKYGIPYDAEGYITRYHILQDSYDLYRKDKSDGKRIYNDFKYLNGIVLNKLEQRRTKQ